MAETPERPGPTVLTTTSATLFTAGVAQASGSVTTTNASNKLTGVTVADGWRNGMRIEGTGIPAGTKIVDGAGTTTMFMSKAATASATVTGTGYPYALLRSATICNETLADARITLNVGADASGKRLLFQALIAARDTQPFDFPMIPLYGGGTPDLISGFADTASALTVTLGLVEGP